MEFLEVVRKVADIAAVRGNAASPIRPQELLERLSVEDLSATAENYFRSIADATPQMAKPFANLLEAPQTLMDMGLILSGLHLGRTMRVLDFGAGTCWFSRYLNQMQCQTISCDISVTALEIGKRLFREFPVVGHPIAEPVFLPFDGHRIDLPDEHVDRIVCHDAFHHIPNQDEVLRELGRVLKTGGVAGFSEPGRYHSQSPQSQYEMKNYNVLENDILPVEIFALARKHGFDDMRLKVLTDMDVSLSESESIVSGISVASGLANRIAENMRSTMTNRTIFFLYKGRVVPDSRSHLGLRHSLSVDRTNARVREQEPLELQLKVENTGAARWIIDNIQDIGVVKIGTHLYDDRDKMLNLDFSRHYFDAVIEPGQKVQASIVLTFDKAGKYRIAIDLVSEGICWFENVGSKPLIVDVTVTS